MQQTDKTTTNDKVKNNVNRKDKQIQPKDVKLRSPSLEDIMEKRKFMFPVR